MSESAEESQRSGARSSGPEWLDRLEQVDRHVASTVKRMVRELQELVSAAEDEVVGHLLAATVRVDGETTQNGILTALVEEARRFASRTAFFLTRPGEVRGWAGRGFSAVEQAHFDYEDGSVWARMASESGAVTLNAEGCAAVCRRLDAPAGGAGILIPFILRGQLGGVLYADRHDDGNALGVASLQLLTHSAAQAVETAALRGGGSSPALRLGGASAKQAIPLWQPPPAAAPPAPEAAPEASTAAAVAEIVEEAPAEDAVDETPPVEDVAPEPAAPEPAAPEPAAPEPAAPEPAEPEAEPEPEAFDEADEAIDFEMVTEAEEDLETAADDIEAELEPEPELEDTSDLWAVAEEAADEVEEEDATIVGSGAAAEPPGAVPPGVGQETVRLDIAALQGRMPDAPAAPEPAAPEPAAPEPAAPEPAAEVETAKLPRWEVDATPEVQDVGLEDVDVEVQDVEVEDFELEAGEELPEADFELEPEPSEPETAQMAVPDFAEDATVVSEDATLVNPPSEAAAEAEPPMTGGYVPPAPEPTEAAPPPEMPGSEDETPPPSSGFAAAAEPRPDATGSQVVPPTDIQGPGSAFAPPPEAAAVVEGEEALHQEARRLARLLVSEIKLYNEEIIEEGRRAGNIYERLKEDIDRSRRMYQERIDPRLLEGGQDYFRLELVQRLAGGDERLLGY